MDDRSGSNIWIHKFPPPDSMAGEFALLKADVSPVSAAVRMDGQCRDTRWP